jgi:hypothetical protein
MEQQKREMALSFQEEIARNLESVEQIKRIARRYGIDVGELEQKSSESVSDTSGPPSRATTAP